LTEAAGAITLTVPSATTFAALEAFVTANSTLLQLRTSGGVGTVPADATFNAKPLTGGLASGGAATGESVKLTGIGIEYGVKPGLYKRLPAGQKA
jgi:hypothetical protein